ncbi:hypothetical protein MBLNU230_g1869t1 [Neophaeotheca triangularis]
MSNNNTKKPAPKKQSRFKWVDPLPTPSAAPEPPAPTHNDSTAHQPTTSNTRSAMLPSAGDGLKQGNAPPASARAISKNTTTTLDKNTSTEGASALNGKARPPVPDPDIDNATGSSEHGASITAPAPEASDSGTTPKKRYVPENQAGWNDFVALFDPSFRKGQKPSCWDCYKPIACRGDYTYAMASYVPPHLRAKKTQATATASSVPSQQAAERMPRAPKKTESMEEAKDASKPRYVALPGPLATISRPIGAHCNPFAKEFKPGSWQEQFIHRSGRHIPPHHQTVKTAQQAAIPEAPPTTTTAEPRYVYAGGHQSIPSAHHQMPQNSGFGNKHNDNVLPYRHEQRAYTQGSYSVQPPNSVVTSVVPQDVPEAVPSQIRYVYRPYFDRRPWDYQRAYRHAIEPAPKASRRVNTIDTDGSYVPPHLRTKKGGRSSPVAVHNPAESEMAAQVEGENIQAWPAQEDPIPAVPYSTTRKEEDAISDPDPLPPKCNGKGKGKSKGKKRQPELPIRSKESRWVKPSTIKPVPRAPTIDWNDEVSEATSSTRGWGKRVKKLPPWETDQPLADWTGNWNPPPLDWDMRPAFRNDQSKERIDHWLDEVYDVLEGLELEQPIRDAEESVLSGEIAPLWWRPWLFGDLQYDDFWAEYIETKEPEPFDEDLKGAIPWWQRWRFENGVDKEYPYGINKPWLKTIEEPEEKGIDPDNETHAQKAARESDQGSLHAAAHRKRQEQAKIQAAAERKAKQKEIARTAAKIQRDSDSLRPVQTKPSLNMCIRTAIRDDMPQILKLYNLHIKYNTAAPETEEIEVEDMNARFSRIRASNLPFLVACETATQPPRTFNGRPGRYAEITLPDPVIGFAFATPYGAANDIYDSAVKLEIWTARAHVRKGIGKCLLDKLLATLDEGYTERADVEFQGAATFAKLDYKQNVKNLFFSVPYEADRPERFWLPNWLQSPFGPGFVRSGTFERIGEKFGHVLSVAVFHRATKMAWGAGTGGDMVDSAAAGQW